MVPLKRIAVFFLWLVLFYGLLAAPWPGLRGAYSVGCSAVGNSVFGSFGSEGVVRFRPRADRQKNTDLEVHMSRRGTPGATTVSISARNICYLLTAEVVALILATPIQWARKGRALLWGLLLAHCLILLRMGITLLYWSSVDRPWALYKPSPFWNELLVSTYNISVVWISFTFVAPVFIWILATLRWGDFERWRGAVRRQD